MLTISGQTGRALDATQRRCAMLKIRDLSLRFESLADDSATWTARTQDLAAGDTILPDPEQAVSIYNDGTRIFHGHVSDPGDEMHGCKITVLGPWWWLRREQLTQAGTASDRPTMELPEQPVRTSLITLLNRAIAKGVPIRIGTIASTITAPKQKLSEMSFADAIAEYVKYIADGVAWWDYSSGLPAFNLTRRAGAIDTTYTIRQDGNELTGYTNLRPEIEKVADRVELTYYTRNASGVAVQAVQAYGTTNPRPGHRQVIAISGPERDTFVPKEDVDFVMVQTADAGASNNNLKASLMQMMPEVQASRATYNRPAATDVNLANGENVQTWSSANLTGTIFTHMQPSTAFINPDTGAPVSRAGKQLLLRSDPPEWLKLPGMERVKITGRIYVLVASTSARPSYQTNDKIESTPPPQWAEVFPWNLKQWLTRDGDPPPSWSPTTSFTQPAFYDRHQNKIWALDFELNAILTLAQYPVQTKVVKPAGFDYLVPPANMARDLQQMQSYTPWRGTISRKGAACDGSQILNRKFNLAGGRAAHATMGALPRAVTYDFASRQVTIELGAPSRHDIGSLAQRFRQSAQTNITYTP